MKNKPKKIAILYSGARYWGGIEVYLGNLFENYKGENVELTLLSMGEWELTKKLQITNYKLQMFPKARVRLQTIFEIAKYLKDNDFDLLVTQGNVSNFYGRLAGKKANVPVLTVIHSEMENDYPNALVRFVYKLVDRLTRQYTTSYIAVSEYLKQELVQSGIRSDKISVILNGVKDPGLDSSCAQNDERSSVDDTGSKGAVNIGTVGRLHNVKNYAALIRAISELQTSNFKLQIAGEGSERPKLERLITDLNLSDKVELLGNVKNVQELFVGWDIYIQPSLSEGFGISVVEAMYASKLIIVTPAGSLPELITDGKTGLITADTSSESIAMELRETIEDIDKLSGYGVAARAEALRRFSVDTWVGNIENIFMETAK